MSISAYLDKASELMRQSAEALDDDRVERAIGIICEALAEDRPLLVCGNGGSAADAMHITAELVGRFLLERRALNCICLSSSSALLTAWSNDHSFDGVFARQVEAYGRAGGVLLALSTSGDSANVIEACRQAQKMEMAVIGLTGEGGGRMAGLCDPLIAVPSKVTPEIQQVHLCVYHFICAEIEARLANASGPGE